MSGLSIPYISTCSAAAAPGANPPAPPSQEEITALQELLNSIKLAWMNDPAFSDRRPFAEIWIAGEDALSILQKAHADGKALSPLLLRMLQGAARQIKAEGALHPQNDGGLFTALAGELANMIQQDS